MSEESVSLPFGARLRRMRLERGMSLSELARRTYFSKGYLSRIENGSRLPSAALVRQCDGALGAGGELIALLERSRPTAVVEHESVRQDGNWVLGMDEHGSMWFQPMDRRQVLATGAASLLAVRVTGERRTRHGRDAAAAFGSMFTELRRLGQRTGPRVMLPTLVVQTRTLTGLARDATGATRRELSILASRYAEYAGWMAQESGQDRAALWWTDTAVELAAAAGDHELSAYSLVRRALLALYAGDAAETVALAQRAQAHQAAGERVRGLAALREAQGHALAGDGTSALHALDRAEALLDRTADDRPRLGSWTVANPVSLARAWCLHDLGRGGEALPLFERELPAAPPEASRFRARWSARYVLTLATTGDLDRACHLVPDLIADCAIVDSATVRSDVAALARVLARRLSHAPVREVHPALAGSLHAA